MSDPAERRTDGARTPPEALALARRLLHESRHAALATADPDTGAPAASRVACAPDGEGRPLLLVSRLAAHTRALLRDGRLSLLFGEASGDGDPMAEPRLAIGGRAALLEDGERESARARFLAREPGARLYADLPDFVLLRVAVAEARLVEGFARAYGPRPDELLPEPGPGVREAEGRVVAHMNGDHAGAVEAILAAAGARGTGWRLVSADALGFVARSAEGRLRRVEFGEAVREGAGFRGAFAALARAAAQGGEAQGR